MITTDTYLKILQRPLKIGNNWTYMHLHRCLDLVLRCTASLASEQLFESYVIMGPCYPRLCYLALKFLNFCLLASYILWDGVIYMSDVVFYLAILANATPIDRRI